MRFLIKRSAHVGVMALGFSLAGAGMNVASAETTLYIGMNGGDMERAFSQYVFPPFEKANNVKVVVVPGTSADVLAKAQAYKDKPQMHVMFLDDGVMNRAVSMGLCEKLKPSPELDQLYPTARIKDDMAAGIDMGLTGLAYNTKLFKEKGWAPPTSWADLADPKYKGKVVFQSMSTSTFGLHAFLMFNRTLGGDDANVEPAFDKWSETVGPNVLEYIPSSAKVAEMLQTGEAGLFPLTYTSVSRLKKRGMPIEYVAPKEGAVVLSVGECVIANNDQPELAQKLATYLLSAEAQGLALKYSGNEPSNPTAPGAGEMKDALESATVIDWSAINQNRAAWNVRWNRSVER
ncbi:ABC transporter substrate-binding protein [Allopusillimonas ginsengisoli]|nr:ABC transporter substrate-binding protein [Allopusillimonas ginsengisoli]